MEETSATGDSHTAQLWKAFMAHCVALDPNARANWAKVEGPTPARLECSYCTEDYGGVLIKCHTPTCEKYYHIECAADTESEGGFSLEADGQALTFHCREHLKPLLFCICCRPYEKEKGMIQCDSCQDWFHYRCLGRVEEERAEEEAFCCDLCKRGDAKYQQQLESKREANRLKDERSTLQQTVMDELCPVVYDLRFTVCPILEEIADQAATAASGGPIGGRARPCRFKNKGDDSISVANLLFVQDRLGAIMAKPKKVGRAWL